MKLTKMYILKLIWKLTIAPILLIRLIIFMIQKRKLIYFLSIGFFVEQMILWEEEIKIVLTITFHLLTLCIFIKKPK